MDRRFTSNVPSQSPSSYHEAEQPTTDFSTSRVTYVLNPNPSWYRSRQEVLGVMGRDKEVSDEVQQVWFVDRFEGVMMQIREAFEELKSYPDDRLQLYANYGGPSYRATEARWIQLAKSPPYKVIVRIKDQHRDDVEGIRQCLASCASLAMIMVFTSFFVVLGVAASRGFG